MAMNMRCETGSIAGWLGSSLTTPLENRIAGDGRIGQRGTSVIQAEGKSI